MCIYKQSEKTKRKHMAINSRKPKEWVKIANGPSYRFTIVRVLFIAQGPYSTAFTCFALLLSHFALPYFPICSTLFCPKPNTTSNATTIPTFSNLNNFTHYCFLN
jgi:hypothetical protein